MTLAVVTGLAFEAKIIEKAHARAKRPTPLLACSGPGGERARSTAERLLAGGAEALVSFGVCGGLDPELGPGDLLLADRVIAETGTYETDPAWRARLAEAWQASGLNVAGGALLGSEHAVAKAEGKRALFEAHGARAVDLESHGIAQAAEAAGAPFLAVRAVADPADRNLPRAALIATGPDGRLKVFTALTTMYLRPWEGPALVRVAYEARLAIDTLERIAGPDSALYQPAVIGAHFTGII